MPGNYALLLVDDEEDLIDILKDFFEDEDIISDVYIALNAEAAIDIIKENKVDIIISDERMGGGLTGREFLVEVRKNYSDISYFYLATGDLDIREIDIVEAGGKGLVIKPYDIDLLVERVIKDLKE